MPPAEIIAFDHRLRSSRRRTSTSGRSEADPTRSGPTRSGPTRSGPTRSGPTRSGPADSEPADSEPADSDPADSEPADPTEVRPPVLDLAGLVTALTAAVGAARRQFGGRIRDVTARDVRRLAADPVAELRRLAARAGLSLAEPVEEVLDFAAARLHGDYAVDEFGFDPELTTRVFLPLLRPLVRSWFRVEVRGTEHLPATGAALLVANHAGTLPLDGLVLQAVVHEAIDRYVRLLGADLIFATPYLHDLARKTGTTRACPEDTARLLATDQLVAVFPEGFKGLGKLYADRYKLQRFGRGGFVSTAIRASVPIVPVAVVGSEEIYPMLHQAKTLAKALGLPYFPITPLFPWLGLLGAVPLPSKWLISFGEPIATNELSTGAAEDPMVVFNITDQVRETIQHQLYTLLVQRRGTFG